MSDGVFTRPFASQTRSSGRPITPARISPAEKTGGTRLTSGGTKATEGERGGRRSEARVPYLSVGPALIYSSLNELAGDGWGGVKKKKRGSGLPSSDLTEWILPTKAPESGPGATDARHLTHTHPTQHAGGTHGNSRPGPAPPVPRPHPSPSPVSPSLGSGSKSQPS